MGGTLRWRVVTIVALLCLLAGLVVLSGAIEPDPAKGEYPGTDEIDEDPDAYVGDRVVVAGTVVETSPVTIENGDRTYVLDNVDSAVAVDDELVVYGTLRAEDRIDAIETVGQEPWELQYMYLVSLLAGLWVLGRLVNRWTIDTADWSVVPRPEPVLSLR